MGVGGVYHSFVSMYLVFSLSFYCCFFSTPRDFYDRLTGKGFPNSSPYTKISGSGFVS